MKKIIWIVLCLLLVGCQGQQVPENDKKIVLKVFTLDTCANCKAFKEIAEPALKKEFKNSIEIVYLDVDDEENGKQYDEITAQLENYDMAHSRKVPFIVVEDNYAVLAYNKGEEKAWIEDLKAVQEGVPLGNKLSEGRWFFKK